MRSGMVAIVGRPNVGKSSLLNALVGRKVSIVAPKPQTTRHRIQGVLHRPQGQIVFVDTPGIHRKAGRALNRYMNEAAGAALRDIDLALFVVEAGRWTEEDDDVLEYIKAVGAPAALILNKVDRLADKSALLPELQKLSARHDFRFVVPVSAKSGQNLEALVRELFERVPEGPPLYPEGQVAGHDLAFTVAEVVREKLVKALAQELPYALAVQTEELEQAGTLLRASVVVWVEREGQKKIVIGEDGVMLKRVGSAARRELEYLTGSKVMLKLWVRVKENWSDDPQALRRFGYHPD
ncbi:MAG: GTPase Era [Nevskia sp.]|nr:GTPase Era [Nevskia sp.]